MEELLKKAKLVSDRAFEFYEVTLDVISELNEKVDIRLNAELSNGVIIVDSDLLGTVMRESVKDLYIDMQHQKADCKEIIIKKLTEGI
ncbi:hypothetical protein [Clostridium paraputrificum]|uniref:hypothetical protein n=1 Tax=Clostridium paraputrificum TaxID=29363 RepID=UPI00374E8FBF